ncbi:MAG: ABC transporter permease, partial [Candidatus Dormibacteraeota bacterium]|nr:ABC transporter permease [Candidatus Dormibacteraeota bacterium]
LGLRSLLAPLFVIELLALIFGLSLLLSSLFVYYRDIGHIWEIVSLVLFYGSAVVFPYTIFPKSLRLAAGVNPVAQIIQDLRAAIVDPGIHPMVTYLGWAYLIPIGIVVAVVTAGYFVFRRLTPTFAENL